MSIVRKSVLYFSCLGLIATSQAATAQGPVNVTGWQWREEQASCEARNIVSDDSYAAVIISFTEKGSLLSVKMNLAGKVSPDMLLQLGFMTPSGELKVLGLGKANEDGTLNIKSAPAYDALLTMLGTSEGAQIIGQQDGTANPSHWAILGNAYLERGDEIVPHLLKCAARLRQPNTPAQLVRGIKDPSQICPRRWQGEVPAGVYRVEVFTNGMASNVEAPPQHRSNANHELSEAYRSLLHSIGRTRYIPAMDDSGQPYVSWVNFDFPGVTCPKS